eukprot:TRINITY_DN7208_c0_g1_i1.p2 TRINITY_DN7208_c0_g1~~TRINITY_DN7208_c0_g1_i1.p2  ORF type:complete len:645 (-),score=102.30 TRINITY_DN7208_c0_g1_i1:2543-4420(-)
MDRNGYFGLREACKKCFTTKNKDQILQDEKEPFSICPKCKVTWSGVNCFLDPQNGGEWSLAPSNCRPISQSALECNVALSVCTYTSRGNGCSSAGKCSYPHSTAELNFWRGQKRAIRHWQEIRVRPLPREFRDGVYSTPMLCAYLVKCHNWDDLSKCCRAHSNKELETWNKELDQIRHPTLNGLLLNGLTNGLANVKVSDKSSSEPKQTADKPATEPKQHAKPEPSHQPTHKELPLSKWADAPLAKLAEPPKADPVVSSNHVAQSNGHAAKPTATNSWLPEPASSADPEAQQPPPAVSAAEPLQQSQRPLRALPPVYHNWTSVDQLPMCPAAATCPDAHCERAHSAAERQAWQHAHYAYCKRLARPCLTEIIAERLPIAMCPLGIQCTDPNCLMASTAAEFDQWQEECSILSPAAAQVSPSFESFSSAHTPGSERPSWAPVSRQTKNESADAHMDYLETLESTKSSANVSAPPPPLPANAVSPGLSSTPLANGSALPVNGPTTAPASDESARKRKSTQQTADGQAAPPSSVVVPTSDPPTPKPPTLADVMTLIPARTGPVPPQPLVVPPGFSEPPLFADGRPPTGGPWSPVGVLAPFCPRCSFRHREPEHMFCAMCGMARLILHP